MTAGRAPAGYSSVTEREVQLVARDDIFDDLRGVLFAPQHADTLHAWAQRATTSPDLVGRGPVYAVTLPRSRIRAVVRHNRHGGLLAPITGDRFLPPTQAPAELAIARRLIASGVPTADVLGYAVYPAGVFRRADIVTLEVEASRDLSAVLTGTVAEERAPAWHATAQLIAALTGAGARHEDLNLKNILLQAGSADMRATVLDVDRVVFERANDPSITTRNLARLARSARKWRRLHGTAVSEDELAALHQMVARLLTATGESSR